MKNLKANKKIILICLIVLFLFVLLVSFLLFNKKSSPQVNSNRSEQLNPSDYVLEITGTDKVLFKIYRAAGIDFVKKPSGKIVDFDNEQWVAFDETVEPDKRYTYTITDMEGNTSEEYFITPSFHVEISEDGTEVDFDTIENELKSQLIQNRVATNFTQIGRGSRLVQDTDQRFVLSDWTFIGGSGSWSEYYNAKNGESGMKNTANQSAFSGYLYNKYNDFSEISFQFNARATDSDNDLIGVLARFSGNSTTGYTGYMFILDRGGMNSRKI